MKILVVDNEINALKVLYEAVSEVMPDENIIKFQYSIDAINYSKENIIDIAFLDIKMENINGIELAKRLKMTNNKMNIIFTTGFTDYTLDALNLHASDYILKPITPQKVKKALDNLLYPIDPNSYHIYAKTFGNFDFLVDGKSVYFKRKKAKEVLAYLIDREGATVTKKELASIIFEDLEYTASNQSYLTKIIKELREGLRDAGVDYIFHKRLSEYSIDMSKIYCDAVEFNKGNIREINNFYGEYMIQYSWAEYSLSKFEKF